LRTDEDDITSQTQLIKQLSRDKGIAEETPRLEVCHAKPHPLSKIARNGSFGTGVEGESRVNDSAPSCSVSPLHN